MPERLAPCVAGRFCGRLWREEPHDYRKPGAANPIEYTWTGRLREPTDLAGWRQAGLQPRRSGFDSHQVHSLAPSSEVPQQRLIGLDRSDLA